MSEERLLFELNNRIERLDAATLKRFEDQEGIRAAKPWESNGEYFEEVYVSALAAMKMMMHAQQGGTLEVMGVMQGMVVPRGFVVTDVLALPVEGTETRVNAGEEADEYLIMMKDLLDKVERREHVVGWYHSHPGYGCWLSGVDVQTQETSQRFQDPFLAIVVDHVRSTAGGQLHIGAFRTLPDTQAVLMDGAPRVTVGAVPKNKMDDFGAHADAYYPLHVKLYKTEADEQVFDAVWREYWLQTLTASPLLDNLSVLTQELEHLPEQSRPACKQATHGLVSLLIKQQLANPRP